MAEKENVTAEEKEEKKEKKSRKKADKADEKVAELQAEIKAKVNGLNPVEKKTMKEKLTKANLPTAFNKVADEEVLKKILEIVSE